MRKAGHFSTTSGEDVFLGRSRKRTTFFTNWRCGRNVAAGEKGHSYFDSGYHVVASRMTFRQKPEIQLAVISDPHGLRRLQAKARLYRASANVTRNCFVVRECLSGNHTQGVLNRDIIQTNIFKFSALACSAATHCDALQITATHHNTL